MKWLKLLAIIMIIFALPAGGGAGSVSSASLATGPEQAFLNGSAGFGTVDHDQDSGLVRFIGTDLSHTVASQNRLAAAPSLAGAALEFAGEYGSLFGLQNPGTELTLMRLDTTTQGPPSVRYQQVYQGIPIISGEIIVQLDSAYKLLSMSGKVSPDLDLSVQPQLDSSTAQQTALELTAKYEGYDQSELQASQPQLWIYDPKLVGAPGIPLISLVWRVEVTPKDLLPVDELVLVDAQTGAVRLNFNQVDTALNRQVYDTNNVRGASLPGTLKRSEGQGASSINDVNYAYEFSGETYNFYYNMNGRDSIDNAGMNLISTTRYCTSDVSYSCPYQNAFWNGAQMVYGATFASADDVVGHELTHGVTEKESHLNYYMQSGAINESLSDIFGEFIDQTNNYLGTDSDSTKWLIGEDLPIGAIRSMSDPTDFYDPDSMTSIFYVCGDYSYDSGGVHYNSGVLNKAAFLITDGTGLSSFNGQSITGIGLAKAEKVFYYLQTNLLTSGSDYKDVYNLLPQACTSLVGTNGITASDCNQVTKAVIATAMNSNPGGCATPAEAPKSCPAGQAKLGLFSDGLESGTNNWSFISSGSAPLWQLLAGYSHTGNYSLYGGPSVSASVTTAAMNRSVSLPAGVSLTYYLHFYHAYEFESYRDGGLVEYSIDNGVSWHSLDTVTTPAINGPTWTLTSAYSNPLGGSLVFTSVSFGYTATRYDLTNLAGNSVRFRWREGLDNSSDSTGNNDRIGWILDDVTIYRCGGTVLQTFLPAIVR